MYEKGGSSSTLAALWARRAVAVRWRCPAYTYIDIDI